MANDLAALIPTLISSCQYVTREGLGFIEAVDQDFNDQQAAKGQSIVIPVADAATVGDVAAATTGPTPTDSVAGSVTHSIQKSKSAVFALTGEEQRGMRDKGPLYRSAKIEEAFRALTNLVEADVAACHASAARAYGTAATAPFASTLEDAFTLEKMLFDAGAVGEKHLVLDSAAWLNLGKLTQLTNVNQAGAADMLRFARFPEIANLKLHRSSQVALNTIGTGTGYLVNHATYPVGTTSIDLDTGSGTVVQGDVVTFTGDANKYVVASSTGGSSVTNIVLAAGLKQTLANNVAMTIGAQARRNLAFTRPSIILSTRQPAMPEGGDSADDVATITDPFSGISFQIALYRQRRQVAIEVGLAWGATARKSSDIMALLG